MAKPKSATTIEFGKRVRNRRKELGFSQEGLALASGLDRSYVGQVERGEKNLTLKSIMRLASTLKVDPSELVDNLPAWKRSRR